MAELVGGLAGSLQGWVGGLVNQGSGFIDKWFPPEQRASLWAKFQKFTTEKPQLASFLLSHIAISGFPLFLFFAMILTVAIFSLVAALLIGLIGALLFIVFMVGVALVIILPTLFFTTLVATFLWLFAMGTYYILKYFNQKDIPGIHTDLKTGLLGNGEEQKSEADNLDAINGEPKGHRTPPKLDKPKSEKREGESGSKRGKSSGVDLDGQLNGVTKKAGVDGVTKKAGVDSVTKNASVDGVTNGVSGAKDKLGGVTNGVSGAKDKLDGVKDKLDGVTGGVTKNLPIGL